jgi:PilZ domain-containing protein
VGTNVVRRTPRYSLVVDVEMIDDRLTTQFKGRTKTLSMFGCGVETSKQFPKGTSVRIKLSHQGEEVRALARVIYSSPYLGMGFAFTSLDQESEQILMWWIAEYVSIPKQEI